MGKSTEPRQRTPVVHLMVDGLFGPDLRPARDLDALVARGDWLDRVLAKYGGDWERPSADEAVRVGPTHWDSPAGAFDWAGRLRSEVSAALSKPCSIGIAGTRLSARVCARLARPDGVLFWFEGYDDGLISGLPLEELDELRPQQVSRLRALGVRTLGELPALDDRVAREVLGAEAHMLLGLLGGSDLGSGRAPVGRLGRAISVLSARLSRRLERSARKARGLELRLVFDDGGERERYTLLPRASAEPAEIREHALRLLRMAAPSSRPVAGVALTATGLTGDDGQLGLFRRERPLEVAERLGRTS